MTTQDWNFGLTLEMAPGNYRSVTNVLEAVYVLNNEWPLSNGEEYYKAKEACRAALDRYLPPHIAQKTFIRAAKEAGIYVMPRPHAP
jgi:Protein of unknown function (DUF982)